MDREPQLPPGQHLLPALKVKHYGPVPRAGRTSWFVSFSVDAPGSPHGSSLELGRLTVPEIDELPPARTVADLHCASGWSVRGLRWEGVPAATLVERFPPPPGVVGVLVYGEYGYCANLRLSDLLAPTTLLALMLDGAPIEPEHGFPIRLVVPHLYAHKSVKWFRGWEYLTRSRRGFWEERGYHIVGDPWREQRYSYQE